MVASEHNKVSMRDFLHPVFKRKYQVLVFFLATVCTVVVGSVTATPVYEAASQILVKMGRENIYQPPGGNAGPVINYQRDEQINSEIEILQSGALAQQVVASLGASVVLGTEKEPSSGGLKGAAKDAFQHLKNILVPIKDKLMRLVEGNPNPESSVKSGSNLPRDPEVEQAIATLRKDLEIERITKSDVVQLKFRHTDPYTATTVLDRLIEFFLDHHLRIHKNPQAVGFFEEQSQIFRNELAEAEKRLETLKQQHGVGSLEEARNLLLEQEAGLRVALNHTRSEEVGAQNRSVHLRRQLAATPKTVPQTEETEHSPALIDTLQARLMELELKEKELQLKYTDQSRLVQNVREEIEMVQKKLVEQEGKQYGKSQSGLNLTYQRLQEALITNDAELMALQAKKEKQQALLAGYREELGRLDQAEAEFNRRKQEVELAQKNYRLYLDKFEEARISDAMDTAKIANVTQIQPASVSEKPVSPKVRLNILLALFLGAFGGIGLAFVLQYMDDTLEKPDEVEAALGLRTLASIPELKH